MAKIGELAMAVGRKILRELPNKKYWNGCAKFKDGRVIYDKDVYDFVFAHMRLRDRINARKVVEAALASFAMLEGTAGRPIREDWKFEWQPKRLTADYSAVFLFRKLNKPISGVIKI